MSAERAFVFAPDPLLTVTVEAGSDGDEIHLHAGGQGYWVAQMIANLGVEVHLCGPFGGESGRVVKTLIDQDPGIRLRAIKTAGSNGAYVHDRRDGDRVSVAESPPDPLGRHELDDLYGAALVRGLEADVSVLAGPGPWDAPVVPPDAYCRLTTDLRANGKPVIADLCGEALTNALTGGLTLLKVSHEELMDDGRVKEAGEDELIRAMFRLQGEGAENVLITRAEEPALALVDGDIVTICPPTLSVVDHRGAGDSMTAGVATGLAKGQSIVDALRLGAAAAALNVTRRGLATGDRREIERMAGHIEIESRGEDRMSGHEEGRRWRCLVTNDDGIDSEGLRVLAQVALEAGFEVLVAAPMDECSGASASITAVEEDGRLVVESRTLPGLEDACTVLAVDGLPAFIALTGMRGAFGPAPDVVLSGINSGPNTGYAVLHSGTVGAALTASTFGARALAVSLNVRTRTVSGAGVRPSERSSLCWETAAEFGRRSIPALLQSEPGTVFNVNAPNIPLDEVKGFEQAELARFGAVQTNVAERGEGYVKLNLAEIDAEYEPGTDAALIAAGYATLTPLRAVCEAAAARLPEFAGRSSSGG